MRKIVFDIETKNIFMDVGKNDPALLDISIVCIHDSETDSYDSFFEADFPRLWKILEKADLLIGYNSDHFDIPCLNKYYPGDLTRIKSLDILKEIRAGYGRRMSLDQVAEGTLGTKKIGHGLQAIRWWKEGDLDSLRKYCLEDVRITKEIYDYARKNNKLYFREGGVNNEIKLDASKWETAEKSALTYTLPF
ncbi:MAG TPA: ribonuclease H-like domain-containing protein [Candidatus Paceibacterota bacterium]|nr:ribonuclease H-like domain-containing protein [Candidatus Paceibacterota bacterium]